MAQDLLKENEEIKIDPDMALDGEETDAPKKGLIGRLFSGKKKLIIIGLLVLFILGGGAWVFFFSGPDEAAEQEVAKLSEMAEKEKEIVFEDILEMEPFERIRLKASSGMEIISLGISLELADSRFRKQIYTVQDRLRKIVEAQFREKSWLELRSPEGKIQLKYDIIKRMNALFPKVTIRNLYFTNFIMQ